MITQSTLRSYYLYLIWSLLLVIGFVLLYQRNTTDPAVSALIPLVEEPKFRVNVKIALDGPDSTGVINLMKGGKVVKSILAKETESIPMSLDLNSYYLIKCSKTRYTTKIVYVDTKVPAGREKEEFANFTITVVLLRNVNPKEKEPTKPIGGVAYSKVTADFDQVSL